MIVESLGDEASTREAGQTEHCVLTFLGAMALCLSTRKCQVKRDLSLPTDPTVVPAHSPNLSWLVRLKLFR